MQVDIFDRRAQPLEPEPELRDFRLSVQLHSPPVVERPGCDKTGLERPRGRRGLGGQESFRQGFEGKRQNLQDRKSTRLNSSHGYISYAVFCLKKKKKTSRRPIIVREIHRRSSGVW